MMKATKIGGLLRGLILASLLPSWGVSAEPADANAQSAVESEEYAVYSAVIKKMFISEHTELVLIQDETVPMLGNVIIGNARDRFSKGIPGLSGEILRDYQAKNQRSQKLSEAFTLSVKYVLMSFADFLAFFNGSDLRAEWKAFCAKYPNSPGMTGFSRVGFDAGRTKALLYVENHCGALCGEGNIVLLVKRNAVWDVETVDMIWVS